MPIRFAPEPRNASSIVRAGLDRLAVRESPLKIPQEAFSTLAMDSFHAVYDLRADEVAKGGGLETAHPTGFRYLVRSANAAIAAAEVHTDASGQASLLANLNYGPYVDATARAFNDLTATEPVRSGSYEARLLRFSAIYLVAIWLKADPPGSDIIYPLAPAPADLQAGRAYSVADFLRAIRPIAQKRTAATGKDPVP
jgi:hypothetical protein